jgi:transcriptional regulator GlxA family with amidase domain
MDLDRLAREYPQVNVRRGVKYVDEGRVLTSGGISAGIHLALHLVARWAGPAAAAETARRMEYDISL